MVPRIRVAREELRAVRVRSRDEDRRDPLDVRCEAGGDEFLDELARRYDDLASEMAALLRRGELVLEMDAGGTGLDHRLRDLECMERPSEARLRVRDDRRGDRKSVV